MQAKYAAGGPGGRAGWSTPACAPLPGPGRPAGGQAGSHGGEERRPAGRPASAGPRLSYADLAPFDPDRPALSPPWPEQVEITIEIRGLYRPPAAPGGGDAPAGGPASCPQDLDYLVHSRPAAGGPAEAGTDIRPQNLGQASRISGVSPADIAALMIALQEG